MFVGESVLAAALTGGALRGGRTPAVVVLGVADTGGAVSVVDTLCGVGIELTGAADTDLTVDRTVGVVETIGVSAVSTAVSAVVVADVVDTGDVAWTVGVVDALYAVVVGGADVVARAITGADAGDAEVVGGADVAADAVVIGAALDTLVIGGADVAAGAVVVIGAFAACLDTLVGLEIATLAAGAVPVAGAVRGGFTDAGGGVALLVGRAFVVGGAVVGRGTVDTLIGVGVADEVDIAVGVDQTFDALTGGWIAAKPAAAFDTVAVLGLILRGVAVGLTHVAVGEFILLALHVFGGDAFGAASEEDEEKNCHRGQREHTTTELARRR